MLVALLPQVYARSAPAPAPVLVCLPARTAALLAPTTHSECPLCIRHARPVQHARAARATRLVPNPSVHSHVRVPPHRNMRIQLMSSCHSAVKAVSEGWMPAGETLMTHLAGTPGLWHASVGVRRASSCLTLHTTNTCLRPAHRAGLCYPRCSKSIRMHPALSQAKPNVPTLQLRRCCFLFSRQCLILCALLPRCACRFSLTLVDTLDTLAVSFWIVVRTCLRVRVCSGLSCPSVRGLTCLGAIVCGLGCDFLQLLGYEEEFFHAVQLVIGEVTVRSLHGSRVFRQPEGY